MSIFDAADALLGSALALSFGERILVIPQRKTGSRYVAGEAIDAYEIVAAIDDAPKVERTLGQGSLNGDQATLAVTDITLYVERTAIVAPNPLPAPGDRIRRIEKPGQPTFRVVSPADVSEATMTYALVSSE